VVRSCNVYPSTIILTALQHFTRKESFYGDLMYPTTIKPTHNLTEIYPSLEFFARLPKKSPISNLRKNRPVKAALIPTGERIRRKR
jgi:hypothetical protein